jgi:glycerol uptake facilitator-like aquaporin
MIIWNRWGFLVPVITLGTCIVSEILWEFITKDEKFYQNNPEPLAIALLVAGIINISFGNWINRRKARRLVDKETGEEVILKDNHSFFWIPIEYWGIVLIAWSIAELFLK